MKKYIPVDFDEKGNVILGRERNTPTSNGFIPTTWTPPAPVSEGSGLKSISISPVLETTPALDTVFPIYYEDLTEEEKEYGKEITIKLTTPLEETPPPATVTVEPTGDWYAFSQETEEYGGKGESVQNTAGFIYDSGKYTMETTLVVSSANDDTGETVTVYLTINDR